MDDHATATTPLAHGRQRRVPGAGVPGRDAAPLRRHADRPPGARGRDRRGAHDRLVEARAGSTQAPPRCAPRAARIVVAVDPPVTSTAGSDSCGIIVAGLGVDGRAYVIGDRTMQGRDPPPGPRPRSPPTTTTRPTRIVVETNQGGDLVVQMFKGIDACVPVKKVHASRGKYLRAEPVAALYARGPRRPRRRVPRAGAPDVRLRRRRPRQRPQPRPPRRTRLGHHRADARHRSAGPGIRAL